MVVAEDEALRQLIYGRSRHRDRIIDSVNDSNDVVTVLHIRYRGRDLYQRPHVLTVFAHSLVAIERMMSGAAVSAFQASQQASRIAS